MTAMCMATRFDVDSSSCFLLVHRHTHTGTDATDHLIHCLTTTGRPALAIT